MYREALPLFVLKGRKGGKVWMLVVAATTDPPRLSLWLRYLQAALQAAPSLAVVHDTPSPMAGLRHDTPSAMAAEVPVAGLFCGFFCGAAGGFFCGGSAC